MSTTTVQNTFQRELDAANPNTIADVFRGVKMGHHLANVKAVIAALTATATPDITTAAVKAAGTITGVTLDTGENLPAIGSVKTLRVTTSGTANSVGTYAVSDAAGTVLSPLASTVVGIALLSDDGKTLTFPTTVTGFVIEYTPRSAVEMTANYPVA